MKAQRPTRKPNQNQQMNNMDEEGYDEGGMM
jgi:hypothetical protein